MPSRLDIKAMREIAQLHGGKCLSKEYIDQYTPLKWMCEKGHTWDADFQIIRQGGWCPACLKRDKYRENMLDECRAAAKKKGGVCLSDEFINIRTVMKFACSEGHSWFTHPYNIIYGQWCRKCADKRTGENAKGNLKTFRQIAIKKGGRCLSGKYGDSKTKLEFQCSEGHTWIATPNSITNGSWCAICHHKITGAKRRKHSIKLFQKIARSHKGKVLTEVYTDRFTPITFECAQGHQWTTKAGNVYYDKTWCPICFNKQRGKNFKEYNEKRKNSSP